MNQGFHGFSNPDLPMRRYSLRKNSVSEFPTPRWSLEGVLISMEYNGSMWRCNGEEWEEVAQQPTQ